MKGRLRAVVVAAVAVLGLGLAVGVAVAGGGWATSHSLAVGGVAITNAQPNSVWTPAAVLWSFQTGCVASVSVRRESQGNSFVLGSMGVTNATAVIWVPEADYPFGYGDVLVVASSETNGQVQVIRKGE